MSNDNETACAAAPSLTMPPFTSTDAALWFHRIEALFRLRAITSSSRRADYVIGALPTEVFSQLSHWMTNQSDAIEYDDLKAQIIKRCSPTPEEKAKKLMDLLRLPLGDQRPSTAFQEMRALSTMLQPDGTSSSIDLLRVLWLLRLPQGIRTTITGFATLEEFDLLQKADSLHGASTLASTTSAVAVTQDDVEDDPHAMAVQQRNSQRPHRRPQKPPAEGHRRPLCYYHHRFGREARRCHPPCPWTKNL